MGVNRGDCSGELCRVVLLGDARVGKSALVARAVYDKFSEGYNRTSTSERKVNWKLNVSGRRVRCEVVDTSGQNGPAPYFDRRKRPSLASSSTSLSSSSSSPSSPTCYLVCYKISDPSTLFSAVNNWCPAVRARDPNAPIVLVGCQSDLRRDIDLLEHLSRSRGLAPVSADQALTLSQQSGCALYVETSARTCKRSAVSAFEVAFLVASGKLGPQNDPSPPPPPPLLAALSASKSPAPSPPPRANLMPPEVPPKPPAPAPPPRRAVSQLALNSGSNGKENLYSPDPDNKSPWRENSNSSSTSNAGLFTGTAGRRRGLQVFSGSRQTLSTSPRPNFKTSQQLLLQRDHRSSSSSLLSLSGIRTPKAPRRSSKIGTGTVTIRCQRLNAVSREYEEVEVEVPSPIYETIKLYNHQEMQQGSPNIEGDDDIKKLNAEAKKTGGAATFASKIRNLFFTAKT